MLWWIGTVLGPRSFGPFSLIGWRLAGVSAVNAGQGQQAGPGFSIIQLLGAAATDKTRRDRTGRRLLCVLAAKRYCTRRQSRGAERRGVERIGGTGVRCGEVSLPVR